MDWTEGLVYWAAKRFTKIPPRDFRVCRWPLHELLSICRELLLSNYFKTYFRFSHCQDFFDKLIVLSLWGSSPGCCHCLHCFYCLNTACTVAYACIYCFLFIALKVAFGLWSKRGMVGWISDRGAFFAWRAPILSWPRIMCSQLRMLKFLEPSREMP